MNYKKYTTYNPARVAKSVGIATTTPYFKKSRNVNFTSRFFKSPVNIIPASAPTGVRNAPMLLPITDAYTAKGDAVSVIAEYKTLIGILLIRFATSVDDTP